MADIRQVKPCPRCWGGTVRKMAGCPRCGGCGFIGADGDRLVAKEGDDADIGDLVARAGR